MGGRQSSAAEERPRSNSVDTSHTGGVQDHARNPSRSVMSAGEFIQLIYLQTIRNARFVGSSSDSNGSEEEAGPSTLYHHPMRLRPHGGSTSMNYTRPGRLRGNLSRRSMPVFMMDEADVHLVMCLTRPRITYNDDTLTEDKGECSICLEDMVTGTAIARLPCLCIYHKGILVTKNHIGASMTGSKGRTAALNIQVTTELEINIIQGDLASGRFNVSQG
uniref:RING-type E3 ubiquitin transferase n=1 Tax=Heterorhabditis bacteriophora TaxID=37862 RepID=A0A1I7WZA7_HETBA